LPESGKGRAAARRRDRPKDPKVRVFVVADTRLSREGLCELLSNSETVGVVGADRCRVEVLDNCVLQSSDILLVDLASRDSLALIGALSTRAVGLKVLAYGVSDSLEDVFAVAAAGAAGYLLRDASFDELKASIASLVSGRYRPTPMLSSLRKELRVTPPTAWRRGPSLSVREREIVGYLRQGLMNKEIARRLGIELSTVKNHVHNILEKLHVRRRGEIERLSRQQSNSAVSGPQVAVDPRANLTHERL
jgi:two-component system, NarL family, nitrate/nitrite response regulator NarL